MNQVGARGAAKGVPPDWIPEPQKSADGLAESVRTKYNRTRSLGDAVVDLDD